MSFDFQDAEPIKSTRTGTRKEHNPFTDVIAAIALKKNENDKPLAKTYTIDKLNDKAHASYMLKIRRQLSEAGAANDPSVTVPVRDTPAKLVVAGKVTSKDDPTKTRITFWTVPRQNREKKNTDTADS